MIKNYKKMNDERIKIYKKYFKVIKDFEDTQKKIKRNKKIKDALTFYKNNGYKEINNMLNSISKNKEVEFKINIVRGINNKNPKIFSLENNINETYDRLVNNINLIDKTFELSLSKKKINVFRGIHDKILINELKKIEKTKTMVNYAYTSTSLDLGVAMEFSLNFAQKRQKIKYLLEIEIPKNTNLLYLVWPFNMKKDFKKQTLGGSEFELLLPRGAKFEFINKRELKLNKKYTLSWGNIEKGRKDKYIIYKVKLIGFDKKEIPTQYNNIKLDIKKQDYSKLYFINDCSNVSVIMSKKNKK